jgi:hypothetical protein
MQRTSARMRTMMACLHWTHNCRLIEKKNGPREETDVCPGKTDKGASSSVGTGQRAIEWTPLHRVQQSGRGNRHPA